MKAWHFLPADGKTQYPVGGCRVKVEPGQVLRLPNERPLALCLWGLHASRRPLDALHNAPGPILCRVELSGEILRIEEKACARARRVLWMADATETLHRFAVWCARDALLAERRAGREPDPRSWGVLAVKLRWLDGQATDAELAAAESAARSAAWSAAWSRQNRKLTTMFKSLEPTE